MDIQKQKTDIQKQKTDIQSDANESAGFVSGSPLKIVTLGSTKI